MKDGNHYSKDPEKLKSAVSKSRKTISEKYGEGELSKRKKDEQLQWYKKQQDIIKELQIASKQEVSDFLEHKRDIYKGKSGNRKLIRDNPKIYKSLNYYCEEFKRYNRNNNLPFVCKIDIANNAFTVNSSMLCRCGSTLSFNKQDQEWSKFYCKKCRQSPTSIKHFQLKYGVNWEIKWKELRGNHPVPRGKNERHLLDQLEKIYNTEISRDFTVLQFFPDGYSKDLNIIYEVNEKHHRLPSHRTKDDIRRQLIQNELHCDFVVIWDDTYEIDIHKHV